jgi:hypothetical protein
MKILTTFWAVLFGLFLLQPGLLAADSAANELDGKWTLKRKSDDGAEVTHSLEFKGDQFTFKILNKEGSPVFFAKGKVATEKAGPLKIVRLSKIQWGSSESELESSDDERTYVYTMRYGTLIFASNFDKDRDNEEAKIEIYTKASK